MSSGSQSTTGASAIGNAGRRGFLARRTPLMRLHKDERLVAMVREGNAGAFEAIVDRYQGRLLGFCRQMLRSTEDAEDVLQEVFVNAYRAMIADRREINLRPWLYRIARNRCLNHLRRPVADPRESMDLVPVADGASTAETVHNRDEFRQLLADVGKLPETQRTALMLREMDSLSYEEIAETMDTTVPSVKSLLVRARMSLSEASEARKLTCGEVRVSLAEAAEGITKVTAPVRRHVRECEECERYRKQIRSDSKALATIFPAGPLLALKAILVGKLGGIGGSAASGAGGYAAGGATVGTCSAGGAAVGGAAAGGGAAAASAAAIGAGGGAMGGAIGAKAVAGVVTAAVLTAGAVEVSHEGRQADPAPSQQDAVVRNEPAPSSNRQDERPSLRGSAMLNGRLAGTPALAALRERESSSSDEQEPEDGGPEGLAGAADEVGPAAVDDPEEVGLVDPDESEDPEAGSSASTGGEGGGVVIDAESGVVISPAPQEPAIGESAEDEEGSQSDQDTEGSEAGKSDAERSGTDEGDPEGSEEVADVDAGTGDEAGDGSAEEDGNDGESADDPAEVTDGQSASSDGKSEGEDGQSEGEDASHGSTDPTPDEGAGQARDDGQPADGEDADGEETSGEEAGDDSGSDGSPGGEDPEADSSAGDEDPETGEPAEAEDVGTGE